MGSSRTMHDSISQGAPAPELSLELSPPSSYHLGRTLSVLAMGRLDPTLRVEDRQVRIARSTPDGSVSLRIVQRRDRILVEGWGEGVGWFEAHLERFLGFHDDPVGFRPEQRAIRDLWRRFDGMHLPSLPRVFTRVVQIVLLQLVTFQEARDGWRRLAKDFGDPAPGPLQLRVPPSAQMLAATPDEEWSARGILPRQARTIRTLAKRVGRLENAANDGPGALRRWLEAVPGVGPWTIEYTLGSALGMADAVLLGDYNLPDTLAWLLAREPRASEARMLELLEPYRGHRFRVIRLAWLAGIHPPRRGPRRSTRSF